MRNALFLRDVLPGAIRPLLEAGVSTHEIVRALSPIASRAAVMRALRAVRGETPS